MGQVGIGTAGNHVLRGSPVLWAEERDRPLRDLRLVVDNTEYYLEQCTDDSHLWYVKQVGEQHRKVVCVLLVYVDDFVIPMRLGSVRTGLHPAASSMWTLAKEAMLSVESPITSLGIDTILF